MACRKVKCQEGRHNRPFARRVAVCMIWGDYPSIFRMSMYCMHNVVWGLFHEDSFATMKRLALAIGTYRPSITHASFVAGGH